MSELAEPNLDELAEEFVGQLRRGEHPQIEDFVRRAPGFADDIRELFPALQIMEQARPDSSDQASISFGVPPLLGDYRLIREVGRGGMGVVYEAEQITLERHVAIKILPDRFAKIPKHLLRFRREARSAGRLHHTNIIPVYDIGCDSGVHYFAMQFIQGSSLDLIISELGRFSRRESEGPRTDSSPPAIRNRSEIVSVQIAESLLASDYSIEKGLADSENDGLVQPIEATSSAEDRRSEPVAAAESSNAEAQQVGTLSLQEAASQSRSLKQSTPQFFRNVARIGMQAADALSYAHSQRILHRDIKPSNLMLDIHGNVWMTDFGLAKDQDDRLTHTGDVVGTLRYIAPERFRQQADARSDIFSLGLTLYELITLHSCNPADNENLLTSLKGPRPLPSPRSIDSRVPRDLETIVLKAISHEPDQRYSSAVDMADDLRRYLSDRPIFARRATWIERCWMWCRRNPALAGTASVAAILLVVSCLSWMLVNITRNQRDFARRAETSALVHEHLAKATHYNVSGKPGSRTRALTEITDAIRLDPSTELLSELRDQAISALATLDTSVETIRLDNMQADSSVSSRAEFRHEAIFAVSQGQKYMVVGRSSTDGLFQIVDLPWQRVIAEIPVAGRVNSGKFSRRGSMVALFGFVGEFLTVVGSRTSTPVFSIDKHFGFDFSPDERFLAAGIGKSQLQLVPIQGNQPPRFLSVPFDPESIRFSPDGDRIAVCFGTRAPFVSIVDTATGIESQRLETGAVTQVDWRSGGDELAIIHDLQIEIWNVAKSVRMWKQRFSGTFDDVSISPDGHWLLTHCWDGTSRLCDLNTRIEVLTVPQAVTANWNPEGTVIGWRHSENGVEVVHLEASPILTTLPTTQMTNEVPEMGGFSSSGRFMTVLFSSLGRAEVGGNLNFLDTSSRQFLVNIEAPWTTKSGTDDNDRQFNLIHDRRWSQLKIDETADGKVTLGPPLSCSLPVTPPRADFSSDGSTCLFIDQGRLVVFRRSTMNRPDDTIYEPNVSQVGSKPVRYGHVDVHISPDGSWAVTYHWHSPIVVVWDLRTMRELGELNIGRQNSACFTPDSKQLVTSRWNEYQFWDLPDLKPKLRLARIDTAQPDPIAFDRAGKLAVACLRSDSLDIVDLKTGKTQLRLHRPGQERPKFLAFHPEAEGILTASKTNILEYWDVRALLGELDKLGLGIDGWNSGESSFRQPIIKMTVVGTGDWAEPGFIGLMSDQRARELLDELENAYRQAPTDLNANNLAWSLLTAPESLRDNARALELAEQAFRQQIGERAFVRNTLGMACYRAGKYERAIEVLKDNLVESADTELPWDLFVLSLSHSALGEKNLANNYFQLGNRWMQSPTEATQVLTPSQSGELESIREEAAAALRALEAKDVGG